MARGKMIFVTKRQPKGPAVSKKQVKSIVKREIGKQFEAKHWQDTNNLTLSTTPDIQYLSLVPQATTASTDETRDGDEIRPLSFELNGFVNAGASDTSGGSVRILIVIWKESSSEATTPVTAGDVLHDTDSQENVISPYNDDQRSNYRVLYDKHVSVPIIGSAGVKHIPFRVRIPAKKMNKIYFESASVVAKNHLVLISMCTQTSNQPGLRYYTRLRFRD